MNWSIMIRQRFELSCPYGEETAVQCEQNNCITEGDTSLNKEEYTGGDGKKINGRIA